MITSFYFVLWILLYFLILISGNPFLNEYAFFIVFAAVILLGRLGNSLCRETIDKRNRRDTIALLEIFYTGNQSKLCSIMQKKLWLQAASFIYMFIATVALILGKADWIIVAIFAFFTFITGRYVHRLNAQYKALCATDRLILPDGPLREAYEQYAARRSQVDFAILMPKPSSSEKALRIFNIIVSVVCILIGLYFIYLFGSAIITYGSSNANVVINFAYGLLALIYGINDLYTLIKGYNFNILN